MKKPSIDLVIPIVCLHTAVGLHMFTNSRYYLEFFIYPYSKIDKRINCDYVIFLIA